MNRRTFLTAVAALPFLGFLKPAKPAVHYSWWTIKADGELVRISYFNKGKLVSETVRSLRTIPFTQQQLLFATKGKASDA